MVEDTQKNRMTGRADVHSGREAMLARIREQLAVSAPFDAVRSESHVHEKRLPATAVLNEPGSALDRFREALEAVKGKCLVVKDEIAAADAVARIVERCNVRRLAVSDSPLANRLTRGMSHVELVNDAATAELFDCDAGLTSAQWAIAETGTLVLESESERHRLASLVPPVHIAVIEARQIRQTMAEALTAVRENGLSRTVTFITGPSRTSDIELTLAIGVHGPGELYVIVIEESPR